MKRIICAILLITLILSAAAPAMAAVKPVRCKYYALTGKHNYQQTDVSYPTCTEPGYITLKCSSCGVTTKEENGEAYGHNWEMSGEKDATCTEKGSVSYWCIECDAKKTEKTKALGHKYKVVSTTKEATCLETGEEKVKCSRCSKTTTRETEKTDHVYGEWKISVEATESAKGVRSAVCIHCGKEKTEEYYPEGTLYRGVGDKEAVKVLQTRLTDCGYLNDTIDGIFGKKSEQAVKDFQTKAGLNADGIAWPQTSAMLEQEWQILMGLYEEPVEVTCCTRVVNENGVEEMLYCPDHQILMDAVYALFEEDDTEEEHINALNLVRQMFFEEMDMLYAAWVESSAPADQASVIGTQAMFTGYVNSQEIVWNKQYGENSAESLTRVNEMLHDHWFDLCATLEVFAGE